MKDYLNQTKGRDIIRLHAENSIIFVGNNVPTRARENHITFGWLISICGWQKKLGNAREIIANGGGRTKKNANGIFWEMATMARDNLAAFGNIKTNFGDGALKIKKKRHIEGSGNMPVDKLTKFQKKRKRESAKSYQKWTPNCRNAFTTLWCS